MADERRVFEPIKTAAQAIAAADETIDMIDDLPAATKAKAMKFFTSVRRGVVELKETVQMTKALSHPQASALTNWRAAVGRWVSGPGAGETPELHDGPLEDVLAKIDEVLRKINNADPEIVMKAKAFFSSVRKSLKDVRETIVSRDRVTKRQYNAIGNWERGIDRWVETEVGEQDGPAEGDDYSGYGEPSVQRRSRGDAPF